jgi:hypothetical protein
VCIGWLRAQSGVPDSTPILPVRDIDEAVTFYESAGFDARVYEGGPALGDAGFTLRDPSGNHVRIGRSADDG